MSNTDTILEFLDTVQQPWCDDCVSDGAHVEPRQQVNTICRRLADKGTIARRPGSCASCGGAKTVNSSRGRRQQGQVAVYRPAETSASATSTRLREETLSIEALCNHLDRFAKALREKREGSARTGLATLISELRDQDIVPGHQANMMHTIRGLRNAYVHDHIELGERELAVAKAAWAIIIEWAERHHPEKWRLATR